VFELSPFVHPRKVILGDDKSRLVCRHTGPSVCGRGELRASALDTGAFFTHLGSGGEMEMQRQEENKQQDRRADKALELVRFPG